MTEPGGAGGNGGAGGTGGVGVVDGSPYPGQNGSGGATGGAPSGINGGSGGNGGQGASVAEARPGAGQRYRVGGGLARVRTGCNGWARISQRETNLAMLASVCAGMTPALRLTEIMVPGAVLDLLPRR